MTFRNTTRGHISRDIIGRVLGDRDQRLITSKININLILYQYLIAPQIQIHIDLITIIAIIIILTRLTVQCSKPPNIVAIHVGTQQWRRVLIFVCGEGLAEHVGGGLLGGSEWWFGLVGLWLWLMMGVWAFVFEHVCCFCQFSILAVSFYIFK